MNTFNKFDKSNTFLSDDEQVKFPRTFHVPFSPGATSDDKILKSLDHFIGKEVVITEKADGENTTMNRVRCHARSIDSKFHVSRERVRKFYEEEIKWKLQTLPQFRDIHSLCGENCQAAHSITYSALPSYFLCFAIRDRQNHSVSVDDMELYLQELGVTGVPQLARGIYIGGNCLEESDGTVVKLKDLFTGVSALGGEQEGWVMRLADSFSFDNYDTSVAKFVRANHVTTQTHWMFQKMVENELCVQAKELGLKLS